MVGSDRLGLSHLFQRFCYLLSVLCIFSILTSANAQENTDAQGGDPVSASDLQAAIDAIKEKLVNKQGSQQTLSTDPSADLRAANEHIAQLSASIARLRDERDQILAQLRSNAEEQARQAGVHAEIEENLRAERDQAASELNQFKQRQVELELEVTELRGVIDANALEINAIQNERDEMASLVEATRSERDQVQRLLDDLNEQVNSDLANQESALTQTLDQIAALEEAFAEERSEKDALNTQVTSLRTALTDTNQLLLESEAKAEEMELLATENQKLLDAEINRADQLLQENTEISERINRLDVEFNERLQTNSETLISNLEIAETQNEQLQVEIASLRQVASTSVAEVEALGEQLLIVLNENENLATTIGELRESRDFLNAELGAARSDVQLYANEATAMRSEISRLSETIELSDLDQRSENEVLELNSQLREELNAAEEEISLLKAELIRGEVQVSGDIDDLNDARSQDLVATLESRLTATVRERDELKEQVAALGGRPLSPRAQPELLNTDIPAGLLNALNVRVDDDGWILAIPDGIVFAPGSSQLANGANESLTDVSQLLELLDPAPIRIVGHTDSFGNADANRVLSLGRAQAVADFLIQNFALNPARLEVEGLGETQPIASNETNSGRRANRRVEFFIRQ